MSNYHGNSPALPLAKKLLDLKKRPLGVERNMKEKYKKV